MKPVEQFKRRKVQTRVGNYRIGDFVKLTTEPFFRRVNRDGTLSKVADGSNGTYNYQNPDVPEAVKETIGPKYKRALYSSNNPTGAYPSGIIDGFFNYWTHSKIKSWSDNPDKMEYKVGPELSDSVSDAAWRKYLGLPYNEKFLIKGEPDNRSGASETYRLPKQLEQEIPVDTILLQNKIDANKKFMSDKADWEIPPHVKEALKSDEATLKALRHTYKTGQPVGVSENTFNSRNWGVSSEGPEGGTPPLNVLQNYNIRYDKDTNRMYYSDTYDFNEFDKWLNGTPFRIRGYINLNK